MINFKDKAFCSSPHCENKCGRKMTMEEINKYIDLGIRLSWRPFCKPKTIHEMILNDLWPCALFHGIPMKKTNINQKTARIHRD